MFCNHPLPLCTHKIKLCDCHQVRRRRPDTRLNLQYDKLYVNNVAYWFNEDTEEIELVNQSDGDIESQVWMVAWGGEIHILCVLSKYFCLAIINIFAHFQTVMKAAAGTRLKKRDGTPSKRRKNFMSKSYSSGKEVMMAEIVMNLIYLPLRLRGQSVRLPGQGGRLHYGSYARARSRLRHR